MQGEEVKMTDKEAYKECIARLETLYELEAWLAPLAKCNDPQYKKMVKNYCQTAHYEDYKD